MTALAWDLIGEHFYETGVDHGVLYIPDGSGVYADGVAWNGLVTVTETPSGAEPTAQYADNIKYLNLYSAEEFTATIEAFTFPDQWLQFDGFATPSPGVAVGQQARRSFGLSYRTKIGNDVEGNDFGYKIHMIYGGTASPSERAYSTINDSPEPITFSWDINTLPTSAGVGLDPTSIITVDSTKVDPADLATLEDLLYGDEGSDPHLPTPAEVLAIFGAGVTVVDLGSSANQPSYNAGTHVVTLPTVTGVQWKINGVNKAPGAQPALTTGQVAEVTAEPTTTAYTLDGDTDWTYNF